MIVLDTNVLSEPMRAAPDPRVLGWLDALDDDVRVTSISVGEILVGVRMLPAGRRRDGLSDAVERTLSTFAAAILPYDAAATRAYAQLQEVRRSAGRVLSVEDGMIAAICLTRGARIATRNASDFAGLGIDVINPWESV